MCQTLLPPPAPSSGPPGDPPPPPARPRDPPSPATACARIRSTDKVLLSASYGSARSTPPRPAEGVHRGTGTAPWVRHRVQACTPPPGPRALLEAAPVPVTEIEQMSVLVTEYTETWEMSSPI